MIELVDLLPSLCELAGIEIPGYLQGTSVVPLMENPDREWKTGVFSQFHRRPQESADGHRYMGYSLNTNKYHYIEWYAWDNITGTKGEFKSTELYDLEKDPYETVNIAGTWEMKEIINGLSAQLEAGWRRALPVHGEKE